jgi:hypothetical protein
MKRFTLIIFLALAVTGSASASTSPGDFLKGLLNQVFAGQFDRTYSTLIPDQRKLVSQSKFMDCYQTMTSSVSGATISDFKVTDTYASTVGIPGTKLHLKTTAVSVRYTIHLGKDSAPDAATWHVVQHGSSWFWIISQANLTKTKSGQCG